MISDFRNIKVIRVVDKTHFGEVVLRDNGEGLMETVNIDFG